MKLFNILLKITLNEIFFQNKLNKIGEKKFVWKKKDYLFLLFSLLRKIFFFKYGIYLFDMSQAEVTVII